MQSRRAEPEEMRINGTVEDGQRWCRRDSLRTCWDILKHETTGWTGATL